MSSFQIVSDLHIEYRSDKIVNPLTIITPSADVLILAGDIGSFYQHVQLKTFLRELCPHFKIVLYIPGNHEYYTVNGYNPLSMDKLLDKFMEIEKYIDNLYVLNRSSVLINDTCILGCTLWSEPLITIPRYIVRIHGMDTMSYHKKYKEDLEYIEKMIEFCQTNKKKLIVVSHHCPTYSLISSWTKRKDKYISLYASNLDHLLTKNKVHTWISGHIHINFDLITKGGTRLIGNQRGKPRDKITDYKKNLAILL